MVARVSARISYTITWLGIEAGCLAARLLPRAWLLSCSDMLGHVGFYFCRKFRIRSTGNIAAALGQGFDGADPETIARGSLSNFFRCFVELAVALAAPDDSRSFISVTGKEHLEAALQKGSGVLLLSAHLGNFFLVGTRLALEGFKISVLVNPPKSEKLAQLMDDYRLQIGQRTIRSRPRLEALKKLGMAMRRNEVALVIADEYRRSKGVPVTLFGRTASARRGPATVALRTGAAIVPACMIRERNGSLKLVIEPELELDRSGKGRPQIEENVVRITQWLERTVRAHPEQWNWTNIRWSAPKQCAPEAQEPLQQTI